MEEKIQPQLEIQGQVQKTDGEFKSSFKAWIRLVAFILVVVFVPEQAAQAAQYDWRILWAQPGTYSPNYLKNLNQNQFDIPQAVKNILKDLSGKQINAVKLSSNLTLQLDKPINLSEKRIEEIYDWLKGKPCGSKAIYDYLRYRSLDVAEQDVAY